jgi:hypothetical protein
VPNESRGRENPELQRDLKLCRDDERKLYALLDGDLPRRLGRMEYGMIVLGMLSGGQLAAAFGLPNPVQQAVVWLVALV